MLDDVVEWKSPAQDAQNEFAHAISRALSAMNEGIAPNLEGMAPELRKKIVEHVKEKRAQAERFLGVAEGIAVAARATRIISFEEYQTMFDAVKMIMTGDLQSVDA